jgi:glycosyltransferase involved in cell wall biosynthesis
MRIGIVSPEFPPEKGGIQTYGFEFAQEMARRGHDVTVFTCPHAGGELERADFRVEPLLQLRRRLDRRILQIGSFDVWHAMNASYAWLAMESARVFVTVHGNDFLWPYQPVARLDLRERLHLPFGSAADRWLGDRLTRALVKRALPRAGHIFTNSEYTREIFLRRYPECRDRTTAAMVGVSRTYLSEPRPPRPPGPPRLITVCRLAEPHKNVDLVLKALARLRTDFDFHYTIVGDGYLRPSLEKLTDESGLRDRVAFTGFVDAVELHPLLLMSDLFILTTSATPIAYEGFGLVYIEAAACGLPVLAARIGGAVEAVEEGVTGMFVEEVTTEAVERRLRQFLSGGAGFASLACMKFARRFSWGNVVDHCLEFYQCP